MRAMIAILATSLCLTACSTAPTTPANQPSKVVASVGNVTGTSVSNAVVIHANSELAGVPMEYEWIRKHYPNSKPKGQALIEQNGKVYDQIDIVTATGDAKSVFFDITSFYGKL